MNSYKPLQQKIRKLALARLRESKPLWRDYRGLRQSVWRRLRQRSNLIGLVYLAAALIALANHGVPATPMLMLAMYSTATILWRAANLSNTLYRSMELALFMHLPVSDQDFFDFLWRAFLKSSALTLVYSLAGFVCVAVKAGLGPAGYGAVAVAAVLQWLLIIALLPLLAQQSWAAKVGKAAVAFFVLILVVAFIPDAYAPSALHAMLPLPTAWIPIVFERGYLANDFSAFALLAMILLLIASVPLSLRRFRTRYPVVDLVYPLQSQAAAHDVAAQQSASAAVPQEQDWRVPDGLTPRPQFTQAKFRSLDWSFAPWIERTVARLLNPRQQHVAEFFSGGDFPAWSKSFLTGCKIVAVASLLLLIPGPYFPWISAAVVGLAAIMYSPVLGGQWAGFLLARTLGTVQPVVATAPISYAEASLTILKINLLRLTIWAPVFLAYAALLGRRLDFPLDSTLELDGQVFLLLLTTQPILIMGLHSKGTNDTRRMTLQAMGTFAVIGILGPAYAACALIFFFAWTWPPEGFRTIVGIAAFAGMLLTSASIWYAYKVFYNRGRVDIIRIAD